MSDKSETIKVRHRRSNDFSSVYASGVISSSVPFTGLFNLTFYEDVIGIQSETMNTSGTTEIVTSFEDGDIEHHREDKVRVSMSPETAQLLINLLTRQLSDMKAGASE